MGVLNFRFYKKMLGIFFFDKAVDINIHKEPKNKITTQFAVKVREFKSPVMINLAMLSLQACSHFLYKQ